MPDAQEVVNQLQRLKVADEWVLKRFSKKIRIAIVAHGRFNKTMVASLTQGDALKSSEIAQGNTCINVLDFNAESDWTPQILNYVEHYERVRSLIEYQTEYHPSFHGSFLQNITTETLRETMKELGHEG